MSSFSTSTMPFPARGWIATLFARLQAAFDGPARQRRLTADAAVTAGV